MEFVFYEFCYFFKIKIDDFNELLNAQIELTVMSKNKMIIHSNGVDKIAL